MGQFSSENSLTGESQCVETPEGRMGPGAMQWGLVTGSEVMGNAETQEAPSEHLEPFFLL